MKAAADRATTRQVLAGIDSVLRERTAEAVDRVLATASHAHGGGIDDDVDAVTNLILADLGLERASYTTCHSNCPGGRRYLCVDADVDEATPGMTIAEEWGDRLARCEHAQRRDYAPWKVSPHLFGGER